jgi:hypothetical protein
MMGPGFRVTIDLSLRRIYQAGRHDTPATNRKSAYSGT